MCPSPATKFLVRQLLSQIESKAKVHVDFLELHAFVASAAGQLRKQMPNPEIVSNQNTFCSRRHTVIKCWRGEGCYKLHDLDMQSREIEEAIRAYVTIRNGLRYADILSSLGYLKLFFRYT